MSKIRVEFKCPGLPHVWQRTSLAAFIASLTDVLNQAHPEYRGEVTIAFSAFNMYGTDPTPECEIELLRDPTPEELKAQKAEAIARAQKRADDLDRAAGEARADLKAILNDGEGE